MVNWQQYSKTQLRSFVVETFREGGGSRPDVLLLEKEGEHVVLKDHSGMDPVFAKLIGPLLTWRETKAMGRLIDMQGVPKLLFCPDKRSLLMEYVNAKQVVNVDVNEYDPQQYLNNLTRLIEQMHACGIAHGDLRSPTNALIDEHGEAALVDFVASIGRGSALNVLSRYLFNKMCLVDASAITKLKKRIAPQLLDDNDIESADVAGKMGMRVRSIGQLIRKLSRYLFTKKIG